MSVMKFGIEKKPNLGINMVLNVMRGLMSIIFPLITFPYVSRVLGVENLGRYSFSNSIIGYIALISGLGINTYAIREGSRIRENRESFNRFSNEMFSINILSTVIAYLILGVSVNCIQQFRNLKLLLVVLSLQVVFKTIGVEWVYSIYEDYFSITVRGVLFQIVGVVLLFFFVRNEDDLIRYAFISVFSISAPNIINLFCSHKYCHLKLTYTINWKEHLKPILVLFAMSATVVIYVSSDITILGFLCDEYTVGIYSLSAKIYSIVKTILSALLIVSIPRLSALLGRGEIELFRRTSETIYKALISFVLPGIVGLIVLRKEIVLIFSSSEYLPASSSLVLLSLALYFCMGAWFWGQCILIPCKSEKKVFIITVVSASTNIILNFILIPMWRDNAAAFTTIVAEGIAFVCCSIYGHRFVKISGIIGHYLKVMAGCVIIILNALLVQAQNYSEVANILIILPSSVALYFFVEWVLHNDSLVRIKAIIKQC